MRPGGRLTEARSRQIVGRDPVGVGGAGRIGGYGPVPRNLLLVVEQVVDLEPDPGAYRLPYGQVVRRRKIHHAVALELFAAAVAEEDRLTGRGAEIGGWIARIPRQLGGGDRPCHRQAVDLT